MASPVEALIAAAMGPLALNFTADVNVHFAPLRVYIIGKGSYSVVFRARNRLSNEIVTLKVMKSFAGEADSGVPAQTLREVSILRGLRHPNIVSLRDVLWEDTRLYLVFEYMDTDLLHYSLEGALGIPTIKSFLWQLLSGIKHSHSQRVLHRDLKPANLLIDRSSLRLKIADFGLARVYTPPLRPYTHEVVTQYYRAPEILLGSELYGTAVDLWSIGCIFAELLLGEPLFQGDSEIGQLFKIFMVLGTPGDELWPGVIDLPDWQPGFPQWQPQDLAQVVPRLAGDKQGLDLLSGLLTYCPGRRITATAALRHAYFTSHHDVEVITTPPALTPLLVTYNRSTCGDGECKGCSGEEAAVECRKNWPVGEKNGRETVEGEAADEGLQAADGGHQTEHDTQSESLPCAQAQAQSQGQSQPEAALLRVYTAHRPPLCPSQSAAKRPCIRPEPPDPPVPVLPDTRPI